MREFITVTVPQELLPQVTAEILRFTRDANKVEIVHGDVGRVLQVDPAVVDAWLEWRNAQEAIAAAEVAGTAVEPPVAPEPPAPEPPAPVAPRKRPTSTTTSPLLTDTSSEESTA